MTNRNNTNDFYPSNYLIALIVFAIICAFLLYLNIKVIINNFFIEISIWVILITILSLFTYYCFRGDLRKKFRDLHFKNPKCLILIFFSLTFNFALLLSYWIQFDSITGKKYFDIFLSLITIHATILSIVITLTLLSIQLNIDKYSFDMVELFKEVDEIWTIFGIYMVAIFLDFLVLTNSIPYFEFCMIFSIFAILSVIPYYWLMLALMRPENLIQRYQNKISDLDLGFVQTILHMIFIASKRGEIGITNNGLDFINISLEKANKNKTLDNLEEISEILDRKKSDELNSLLVRVDEIINLLERVSSNHEYSQYVTQKTHQRNDVFKRLKSLIEYLRDAKEKSHSQ